MIATLIIFIVGHPYLAILMWSVWMMIAITPLLFLIVEWLNLSSQKFYEWRHSQKKKIIVYPWPSLANKALSSWEREWRFAGWRRRVPSFPFVGAVVVSIAVMVLIGGGVLGFIGWFVIICFGYVFLQTRATKNRRAFVNQLPDGLMSLTDMIRSGFSWPQAVRFAAEEFDPPLQPVFQALSRAFDFQLSPGEALERVAHQLAVPEWTMVAETIRTQQELGGNILPLLEEIARAIRDRLGVEQEIKTMTAAGRMSGLLIAGLMPLVVVVFWFISPNYLGLLFTTALGQLLFGVAFILEIIGFVWIRQVVKVDF